MIAPTRTASGYRLYDEAAIKTLLAMRALVDTGWTASEAARAIGAGEIAIDDIAVEPSTSGGVAPTTAAAHRARLVDRFVAAAESTSPAETEAALDEILASGSFEAVVDDLLLPAAAALGDSWASGRLSVAAEHAASGAIGRRLAAAYQAATIAGRPAAVVGLPPGSRHELGALAFAVALRRRGVGVLYLGPDVPVGDWVDVTRRTRARAAVIAVVTESDRAQATAVVEALHAEGVPIVAVGGVAATPDLSTSDGLLVLPQRVVDAAAAVAEAVGRRG